MRPPLPIVLLSLLSLLALGACRGPGPAAPIRQESVAVGASAPVVDLVRALAFIQPWAQELLQVEALRALEPAAAGEDPRVLVYLAGFANDSHRPIDLEPLTAALERALLGSGRLRFAPEASRRADIAARALNLRRSGSPIEQVALRLGRQLGARVALYGTIEEGRDGVWRLGLCCLDLQDGKVLWSKEGDWSAGQEEPFAASAFRHICVPGFGVGG